MLTPDFIAVLALIIAILAGILPSVAAVYKYRNDKRLDYVRTAARKYFTAASYAAGTPENMQRLTSAALLLQSALPEKYADDVKDATGNALDIWKIAQTGKMPPCELYLQKAEKMNRLITIINYESNHLRPV